MCENCAQTEQTVSERTGVPASVIHTILETFMEVRREEDAEALDAMPEEAMDEMISDFARDLFGSLFAPEEIAVTIFATPVQGAANPASYTLGIRPGRAVASPEVALQMIEAAACALRSGHGVTESGVIVEPYRKPDES